MSPGRNDSPGGTVPFGFSFAIAEVTILKSPDRTVHPGLALGMLVSARRSRSASQSIKARASKTTMKILRNEYMTRLAIFTSWSNPIQSKSMARDLDLDQEHGPVPRPTPRDEARRIAVNIAKLPALSR